MTILQKNDNCVKGNDTSGYIFSFSCIIQILIHAQIGSYEYKSAACLSVNFELLPGLKLLALLRNAGCNLNKKCDF